MFYYNLASFIMLSIMTIISDIHSDFIINSNATTITNNKSTKIYWNIPTFQCDSHRLNFTTLASKYNIVQNRNDRFHGDNITILYDPGSFPALLTDPKNNNTIRRNGGIPQDGNLTLHLIMFENYVDKLIPNRNFSGVAIIDFESWRPIYRQNFGVLTPYKTLSVQRVRMRHPFWPARLLDKEAQAQFELYARQFMEETLFYAKEMRPYAVWGYYAYPYCFNMAPNHMQTACPEPVPKENDRLAKWLFARDETVLYPSLYLSVGRLITPDNRLQLIEGRIDEAHRIIKLTSKIRTRKLLLIPYFWYKYQDNTEQFLTKQDLFNSFLYLSTANIDGLILWGSSNDVNTKKKCLQLYEYVDKVMGPALRHNF